MITYKGYLIFLRVIRHRFAIILIKNMNSEFKKIIKAAKAGGQILKKYFGHVIPTWHGQDLKIKEKTTVADFQTEADLESEKAILEIISKNFPDYNIYSEERGHIDKKSEHTFVIDPLDGSNNFVLGIPNFSTCIALLKNNQIIFSVVYNPILNQVYYGQKGKGAFLDGQVLSVNKEADIKKATIAYTCKYTSPREYFDHLIKGLHKKEIKRILTSWSPALDFCLLASGKIEAMINYDNEIYDYMPGKLIAREAGAMITDFKGEKDLDDKNNTFLVSNGTRIHQQLLDVL